eukprot:7677186-Karenia_brevis.AAC.1
MAGAYACAYPCAELYAYAYACAYACAYTHAPAGEDQELPEGIPPTVVTSKLMPQPSRIFYAVR